MTEPTPDNGLPREDQPAIESGAPASVSKRRLIRAGAAAVPVIATLTSRPAQAWHCQTGSAWGSEQVAVHASHTGVKGHKVYTDETWTLYNWCNDTARSATGTTYKPWNRLTNACPSLKQLSSCKTNGVFDYKKVTVRNLRDHYGLTVPSGVSVDSKVCTMLAVGDFGAYCVAAQLNRKLLAQYSSNNIEMCVSLQDLQEMATLTYPSATAPWSKTMVKKYLYDNWMVRSA